MRTRDRHTYVAPGRYAPLINDWGRVPKGGTQLCRFHELNDKLGQEVNELLATLAEATPGLRFVHRTCNLSSLQWDEDCHGAHAIGLGLRHEATRPEGEMTGFAWLHYVTEGSFERDEYPLHMDVPAAFARNASYYAGLIMAAVVAHRQLMTQRRQLQAI